MNTYSIARYTDKPYTFYEQSLCFPDAKREAINSNPSAYKFAEVICNETNETVFKYDLVNQCEIPIEKVEEKPVKQIVITVDENGVNFNICGLKSYEVVGLLWEAFKRVDNYEAD